MSYKNQSKKQLKRALASKAAATRRALKRKRPLHKRLLLHPVSVFGLLCVGVFLTGITWHSLALSYTVTATVPAPPLTEPAIITSPEANAVLHSTPISVSGSCPANSYVTLTRNGLFSGVSICTGGSFSISTDLFAGLNQLQAQDYNITNQAGPTAPSIDVSYNPPSTPATTSHPVASSHPVSPLILDAAFTYQVFKVGQNFQWTIDISGGVTPHNATVTWGDGSVSDIDIGNASSFTISHTYFAPLTPAIKVTVYDSHGDKTTLQLATIITSTTNLNGVTGSTANPPNSSLSLLGIQQWLWLVWPVYGTIVLMAISFWLGEYQEYSKLLLGGRLPIRKRS
jgi:hypothetical protein